MIKKILKFLIIFLVILGVSFSNGPFYIISNAINSYIASRDIVDKAFNLSKGANIVDKFNSFRNLAEGIKIQEAHAAASYIGNSNIIYTNGKAPGEITPNASTTDGDLLVFYHYSRATGGNETVTIPAGFTPVFNSVTASRGLVAVGWRIKQAGDSTFTASITNHATGNSGETIIEFIQTYRGTDSTNPIANYTSSLSNWTSSLNIGPIAAPAIANVNDGDTAVVFGGRFENVTEQTVLAGDSLIWAVRTTADTALGGNAGAVVQTGLNSTGTSQTLTAKTVATTGTAQAGAGRMFIIKKASSTTAISDFVSAEPGDSTIAPGASGEAGSFGLATNSGIDSVTDVTVYLAAGMGQYIQTVAITNDAGIITYCSVSPSGDSASLSVCDLPVSTADTQFKIKLTAKSHALMPVPAGAEYAVTARVTSFTSTNTQAGSDSGSSVLTIDNLSPGGTAGAAATPDNGQIDVSWSNPGDADFQKAVIYCKTANISETPTEGSDPAVDGSACDGTARVKYSGAISPQTFSGLANGTTYYFRIFARDTNGNFTAIESAQQVSAAPVAPSAIVTASASGAQAANLDSGAAGQYIGAAFRFQQDSGAADAITALTISETSGTLNANSTLSNAMIRYEVNMSACSVSPTIITGTLAKSGVSFNVSDKAIFSSLSSNIPLTIGPANYTCVYLFMDLANGINNPAGGAALDFEISANTDFILSGGSTKSGTYPVSLSGTTTIRPNVISFLNSTEPALLDGGREPQTIVISGAGFGTTCNVAGGSKVSIGASDLPCTGAVFSNTSISIPIDSSFSDLNDGGTGANGLLVTIGSVADNSRQTFYVYPSIASPFSGQIGEILAVSGNHFGASPGTISINGVIVSSGTWGATSITGARVPGQTGKTSDKIIVTRISDGKTAEINFTTNSPSLSSSDPASAEQGQTLKIIFKGLGIDTEAGPTPTLELVKGALIIPIVNGTYQAETGHDYEWVSANFNLSSAETGSWDLKITNGSDGQWGVCGGCFAINPPSGPVINNITPSSSYNFDLTAGVEIQGSNFDSGAVVKLTKSGEADIVPSVAFSRDLVSVPQRLYGGEFDLTGKATGAWTVVVTNSDNGSASYSGFTINSAISNIYQFKDNADTNQPPTSGTDVALGYGIGNQSTIYFRAHLASGKNDTLYPQVEMQLIGNAFRCNNLSPENCDTGGFGLLSTSHVSGVFNGTPVIGWTEISGITGAKDGNYHWQVRLVNSLGQTSNWVSFGGTDENAVDTYLDNTPPTVTTSCSYTGLTDTSVDIDWSTSDILSGSISHPPAGSGGYAAAQIEYKEGTIGDWATPGNFSPLSPDPYGNSPHTVSVSGLTPNTDYVYRTRSKDYLSNEGFSSDCTFKTSAARPIKTVEFFIGQEIDKNTGGQIIYPFTINIPESPQSGVIAVKSAIIEVTGISGASANKVINIGFLRGNEIIPPGGADYAIDSTGTNTPFTILFNALSGPGTGNENMNNITLGDQSYAYTLFLNGGTLAEPISVFSAKLILTYSYIP